MKALFRRLSRVADSSHYHPLHPTTPRGNHPASFAAAAAEVDVAGEKWSWRQQQRRRRVPIGHVPVSVGQKMERFSVRAELLGRPAFVELLRRSEQEYGYDQGGVLHIPCSVPLFRRLLLIDFAVADADPTMEEIFRSLSGEFRPASK